MIDITVNTSPGKLASIEPAIIPAPLTLGYGACSNRMVCGCAAYRGMNNQPCQNCGHGFGAHY
jgi:hypothetical protein